MTDRELDSYNEMMISKEKSNAMNLSKLFEESGITLYEEKNQYGEAIQTELIFFKNGQYIFRWLQCRNSLELGFGTCRCQSHDPFADKIIDREEVLKKLRANVNSYSHY